jgi:hypothetical protein
MMQIINTRSDLDAIAGTPAHASFMAMLAGSLWRLEKDDVAQTWRAVEDNTTIERFGFTRADFPDVVAPQLPVYVAPQTVVFSCTSWQIRKALNAWGLRQVVEDVVASSSNQTLKDGWAFATEFRSDDPFVIALGASINKTEAETTQMIQYASTL